jgi:mono/diheme cytochrome c family protein
VRDYLLRPHDLRPNLAPTMPRLALSADQARDIATYLTSSSAARTGGGLGVRADGAQVSHGKQLLSERGCTGCHEISGSGLPRPPHLEAAPRTLSLAPDLRFERERADPESIARWLLEPGRVKPDAVMPNLGLRPEDARDLAAFLSFGELSATPSPERHERLPLLTRRIGFDEVNEQVFRVTCRHCHTSPDSTDGDGGPGSTGGFGFPPRKIDFSSYRGIQSGALDGHGDGQRVSLFSPTSEGLPRLVAALVARQREIAGAPSDEVRGMPLGLPALSDQQIQLVESWVAQGRPL